MISSKNRLFDKNLIDRLLSILPWILSYAISIISAYLYLKKTASFRFFDEENNIVAGYLMTQGRALYKDIFMNHNPLPLVISQLLQFLFPSNTLFELVKLHRVFMVAFGLLANALLLVRFRSKAILFVGVYEFLRFYISGQMFLAEGMIAYMFAYFVFLLSEKYFQNMNANVSATDLITSSILFVFICLSREPYVPVAILMFMLILLKSSNRRHILLAGTFSTLTIVAFMLQFDPKEFYKQVVLLNGPYAAIESKIQGGAQIFSGIKHLYEYIFAARQLDKPLYIILGAFSAMLYYTLYKLTKELSNAKKTSTIFVVLAIFFLAGLRNFEAGVEWFGMYRSIPYIVIMLSLVSYFANKKILNGLIILVFLLALIHPRSHFIENRDNSLEYYINYSESYTVGHVVSELCKNQSNCSLFTDGIDVYPYWVSKITPSYQYSFYYPINNLFLDYKSIRNGSLISSPPTVYYDGACKTSPSKLPDRIANDYTWLMKTDTTGKIVWKSCVAFNNKLSKGLSAASLEELRKNMYVISE